MNPATALATVLVDELVRCGMTEAVLAPGSRSAPLALALAAEPRVRLHVRLDERSASFLALGLAKASGRPAALVCTSGTAAANFHPAVLEADSADVPLLVLTADRPPELRGTGANQTIDQIKLYGGAVRFFAEVGVPERRTGGAGYWRSLACRAWGAAATGPVHLNVSFREPLIPDGNIEWPEPLDGRPGGEPWTQVHRGQAVVDVSDLVTTERALLVLGDGASGVPDLLRLAEVAGWPVLAEPSSGGRCGPNAVAAYSWLLGAPGFAAAQQPELIVSAGRVTLSRPLLSLLGSGCRHVVLSGSERWPDPPRMAAEVRIGRPALPAGEGALSSGRRGGTGWLDSWLAADRAATAAAAAVLDGEPLSEPRVARDVAAAAQSGSLVFAGSSMPARDLNLMMMPRTGVRVLANRGASGIDGLVSTAIGAALASGGPAYALLGDLSLLHDRNGLSIAAGEPRPNLAFVVLNNDGGGIFSLLPQANAPHFERVFGTPQQPNLKAVANEAGAHYRLLQTGADLDAAVSSDVTGIALWEVRTDRAAGAALHGRLQQAVVQAVSAGLSGPRPA